MYVDDVIYCACEKELIMFERSINQRFEVKIRDLVEKFVGQSIKREQNSITLCQTDYISEASKTFEVQNIVPRTTLIDDNKEKMCDSRTL